MTGFIKYMRSEEAEFLLSHPTANHLLMVMASRARRTDHPMNGLKAGQCFLGDYSAIGMTERQYRTAKKQLEKWKLATFKGTNKGTVGTLLNSKVYDINSENDDRQVTDNEAVKRQAGDGQVTTNKECNNGISKKEEVKVRFTPPTHEEVFSYMTERGYPYNSESEKFIDFYSMKGWMVGKNKMKDWKAAVRNWLKNCNLQKKAPVSPANKNTLDDELRFL